MSWMVAPMILGWLGILVGCWAFSRHLSKWRRAPKVLSVLGWVFLIVGCVSFFGHVLKPSTADDPVLGNHAGWIWDAMSLTFGIGALLLRKRLLAERVDS